MLARIRSIGASGAASRSHSGQAAKPGTSRGFSARKFRFTSGNPAPIRSKDRREYNGWNGRRSGAQVSNSKPESIR